MWAHKIAGNKIPLTGDGSRKARAQRSDEAAVGARRHDLHRRESAAPCQVEREREARPGDEEVGPGVERPLPVPHPCPALGERCEIRYGPLVTIWPTGADHVA